MRAPTWECLSQTHCSQECCRITCPYCRYEYLYRAVVIAGDHDCITNYFPEPFKIKQPIRSNVQIAGDKTIVDYLKMYCHNCGVFIFARRMLTIECERCHNPFRWTLPNGCGYWRKDRDK